MAKTTRLDRYDIEYLQRGLRKLVPDEMISDFEKLGDIKLQADGLVPPFGAATWLEDIVNDRRQALIVHAKNLQTIFDSLADTIGKVYEKLKDVDIAAADSLGGSVSVGPEGVVASKDSEQSDDDFFNADSAALDDVNSWIDGVNGMTLPEGEQNFEEGEMNYSTGVVDGDPQLSFGVNYNGDGGHATNEDGELVLALPDSEPPDAGSIEDRDKVIEDTSNFASGDGKRSPRADLPAMPDGLLTPDGTVIPQEDE